MPDNALTIEYRHPTAQSKEPNPAVAMILCLPGMICWCSLLGLFLVPSGMRPQLSFLDIFPPGTLLICWATAILAALVSLGLYARARKPWYVCINLAVNIAGLLFTGGVAALVAYFMVGGAHFRD